MGDGYTTHGSYARSVVRVLDGSGMVVGAGFLVASDVVATCAHVVSAAIDHDPLDDRMPLDSLLVDFPMSRDPDGLPRTAVAKVTRWSPIRDDGTGDVALLRLESAAPPGARVPPLRGGGELWDHEFQVFGFPADMADGVWATGRIRDLQATGWLQLQGAATDQAIDEGYSGSPVWDDTVGAVIGMTVARARDTTITTAYVIPMAQVLDLDPELLPCPYRGLAPFEEEHAAFFYGRDEDVRRLVDAAGRHPVVAVAGRSGTGKSSLVRAGLLPVLRREGATVIEYRLVPEASVARSLAVALARALNLDSGAWHSLEERLSQTVHEPEAMGGLVDELVERAHGQIVVLMDQFEEAVATEPERAGEALAMAMAMATAWAAPPERYSLRVVLTLRWESLGSLLTPDLAAMFEHSTVFVTEMSRRALREAVVKPAEHAPGLYFEDGLIARILDDAGAEPGRLPLVESLLAELWRRRSGGSLTTADYESLGGVSGSLVQLAEHAMGMFTGPDEPQRVRRLLTQLAQPADEGFIRKPVAFDSLEPELRTVAHRLADSRLVVLGSAPDGETIVELAHQALIEHWPRLREWLVEDRDFLSWRQRLETQYGQWSAAGRDAGALLRGTALAAALDWTRMRTSDVPEEVRTYVELSRRRQRRDVRRWRAVTAVLTVLVLAAGTLAAVAADRGNRIRHQLDAANAEALAQLAVQRASVDPVAATQLALAGYRSDPANLTARTALAREYLAMRSVDAVFPEVAASSIGGIAISGDGRTAILAVGTTYTVISGLAGRTSRVGRWDVPGVPGGTQAGISGDGHWLVGVTSHNAVLLWDLSRHAGPAVLAGAHGGPDTDGRPTTHFSFSPDSARLAWLDGRHLTVRDLSRGTDTEHEVVPATRLALTGDPGQVMLGHGDSKSEAFEVRALRGGHRIRAFPAGTLMADGTAVLRCDKSKTWDRTVVTVTAPDTGRRVARFSLLPFDDCPSGDEFQGSGEFQARGGFPMSADFKVSNGFLVEYATTDSGPAGMLARIVDLRTGRPYDASTPPETGSSPAEMFGVYRGTGGPTLVLARGRSVLRIGSVGPDWFGSLQTQATADLTPDGRYVVTRSVVDRTGEYRKFVVHDRVSGVPLGALTPPGENYGFGVGDSLFVIVRQQTGVQMSLYTLPSLRPKARYTLTLPEDAPEEPDYVAQNEGGKFVAVVAGVLAVWDSRTQRMIGAPQRIGPPSTQVEIRPGHPGQVALIDVGGSVRLWNIFARRVVLTVPVHVDAGQKNSLVFDDAGDRVAVVTPQNTIQVWNVKTGRREGPAIPVPGDSEVVGFTADGYLLYSPDFRDDPLTVVDFRRGQSGDALTLPVSGRVDGRVEHGLSLQLGSTEIMPFRFPVIARQWFDGLCARIDRPFTRGERAVLPPGADTEPPCR